MTTPRPLPLFLASILLFTGASAQPPAKKEPAPSVKTWARLTEHVLSRGGEWPVKAPASRTLGYDSDSVPAKSLGIDQENSKDDREHNIAVVYDLDGKGVPRAREIVLANIRVKEIEGKEHVDGYRIRLKLNGSVIRGMRAVGEVGKVVQTPLTAESSELKGVYRAERDLYLGRLDWARLTFE